MAEKDMNEALETLERVERTMNVTSAIRDEVLKRYQNGEKIEEEVTKEIIELFQKINENAQKDNEIIQMYFKKIMNNFNS